MKHDSTAERENVKAEHTSVILKPVEQEFRAAVACNPTDSRLTLLSFESFYHFILVICLSCDTYLMLFVDKLNNYIFFLISMVQFWFNQSKMYSDESEDVDLARSRVHDGKEMDL